MNSSVVAIIIASVGMIGTILLLVLNLTVAERVTRAESKLGSDVSAVRLELANFRTEAKTDHMNAELALANMRTDQANSQAKLYQTVIEHISNNFVDRNAAKAMHSENVHRLDRLDEQFKSLNELIADRG